MATVNKTLTWQVTAGTVDHYEIGIATTASGTPVLNKVTTDASTSTTITYDASTYPTAWLFVRAVAADGTTSDWSAPISAVSLVTTYTPPQGIQYAYANDVTDLLAGVTIPAALTTFKINKACLAASRKIDALTHRKFSPQTVVEKYDGTETNELALRNYPITKLNYVKVTNYDGLTIIREYAASDLELSDYEAGLLTLKPIMLDNLDTSWNTAVSLMYGHVFPTGCMNVEVSYEYGHTFYVEGETLQYLTSVTNGSTGVTTRTYQAIHHNWSSNDIAIYQNGSLLTTNVSIDTTTGIVSVVGGADDDTITAYYYHLIPHAIETACAQLAAIDILNQVVANTTGGITGFRNMNYQETYGAKPYTNLFDTFQKSIDNVVQEYRSYEIHST